MVQGGTVNTGDGEYFAQGLVELIQENDSLKEAAESFLEGQEESLKNLDLTKVENVVDLLSGNKGEEFLKAISGKLLEEEKFKKLAEQIGKDRVVMEKLEALGSQLLVQGVIGGVAVTALTGALAGTLAIGGTVGALAGGGIALLGFVAIVAIAAIGYAVYRHRGEIKEGAESLGKAIKSFVKNVIDKLPEVRIQDRDNNFYKLYQELSQLIVDTYGSEVEDDKAKNAKNTIEVIKMLQNEGQLASIKELIKDGTIQNFSEEDMKRFVDKGLSTHEADKDALNELMNKFQPAIMAIGSDIREVERKVNEKVEKMRPPGSQMNGSSAEQVAGPEEQITPP